MKDHPLVREILNAQAWYDGIVWAFGDAGMRELFRTATGIDLSESRSPLDVEIDDATGKRKADLEAFVEWWNRDVWGSEWVPGQELPDA